MINDIEFEDLLIEAIKIDPLDLQIQFAEYSAHLAYWGARMVEAERDFQYADKNYDEVVSKTSLILREQLTKDGKKPTEATIEAATHLDPEVSKARQDRIESDARMRRLKTDLEAVRSKRDMLMMMGAQIRAEIQADPRIKDQMADAKSSQLNNQALRG